jgi:hypothetical protein
MQETEPTVTTPHQQLFDIEEEDVLEEFEEVEVLPSDFQPQTPPKRYSLRTSRDRSYKHRLDHAMDDPEAGSYPTRIFVWMRPSCDFFRAIFLKFCSSFLSRMNICDGSFVFLLSKNFNSNELHLFN